MSYETKNIRNVCLLGHGGSGKTTLAESMLYMTGAIDRQGKTADGNTVCDYDPEEIKRQITISTSIAPVNFGGCKINVLDCPGFFDFAGDVMCALRAVEAGIIFCTAKDGIAVGAERSWKYLKNANMPCMFYVSKTNEDHGDFAAVLSALQEKHGSAVCAVTAPMSDGTGVIDLVHNVAYQTNGNKTAKVAVPAADADMVESLRETLFETAAGADEELMEKYFEDMMLSEEDTVKGLRQGLKDRTVFPVLCGAADSGIGTEAVLQAIVDYVPNPAEVGEVATADGGKLAIDPNGPVCAFVFKTISDQFGKYSFIKVLSGKVTSDLSLRDVRMSSTDKLGRMYTMCGKKNTEVKEACCGDIVAIGKMGVEDRRHRLRPEARGRAARHRAGRALLLHGHQPQDQGPGRQGRFRPRPPERGGHLLHARQQRRDPPDGHLRRRRHSGRRPVRQAQEPLRRRDRAQARPRRLP